MSGFSAAPTRCLTQDHDDGDVRWTALPAALTSSSHECGTGPEDYLRQFLHLAARYTEYVLSRTSCAPPISSEESAQQWLQGSGTIYQPLPRAR